MFENYILTPLGPIQPSSFLIGQWKPNKKSTKLSKLKYIKSQIESESVSKSESESEYESESESKKEQKQKMKKIKFKNEKKIKLKTSKVKPGCDPAEAKYSNSTL